MTPEAIITAFEAADLPPADALRAALQHADALAPAIYELADKFCVGVYLMPPQEGLLFHGLHVLAAVRHPDLHATLWKLLRQPGEDLDVLFPDHAAISLTRMLLSTWEGHGDPDVLFQAIEHADLSEPGRWALFDVLSRLTHDGRIARQRTEAFLERFERDAVAGDDDNTWWSWEGAVTRLGLVALEPALRRVWLKDVNQTIEDGDHREALAELARAAADPADTTAFDKADVRPILDVVESLEWIEARAKQFAVWQAEIDAEQGISPDNSTVDDSLLTEDEIDWLEGFLASRQVPETTMSMEMVDGFLTALIIGPVLVPPSEYLAVLWGTEDGRGPLWDSDAQLSYFMDLLTKHWNAIADRRMANVPIEPLMLELTDDTRGLEWAIGFQAGVVLRGPDWEPLARHKRGNELVLSVLSLTGEHEEAFDEAVTPEIRAGILDDLPVMLQMIAAFWREGASALPGPRPAQSTKVGRNEPCPCGSGKKYKKCCGGATPSTLH